MSKFQEFKTGVAKGLLRTAGLSWLVDAANPQERYRRPWENPTLNTIGNEVNLWDWQILVSDSRKLYCNLGPAKGAINDKGVYSIGRAWNPKFTGTDKAWGDKAAQWLREMWYPVADVRGGMFDFKTDLYLTSIHADRDGEVYILLTESANGFPQIQLIPATMIGVRTTEDAVVEDGPYAGLMQRQGIIFNEQGRAVAYNVLGEKPEQDQIVSARDLIQVFDPEWADQVRGFPVFTHALLDLKDLRKIQGNEKIVSEIMSSIGLIETNELGAPDPNDPGNFLRRNAIANNGTLTVPEVYSEVVNGVRNMYFRSGSGSKLERMDNNRPGSDWEKFMNRLIRNACVGAGWPYELGWDSSLLGGANVRLLIARAMRTVEDRQDLIRPIARRIIGYAISKAIKLGQLEANAEWYKWTFSLPPRMSVDYGRDAKADRDDCLVGLATYSGIWEEEGLDADEQIEIMKSDKAKFEKAGLIYAPAIPPNTAAEKSISTTEKQAGN